MKEKGRDLRMSPVRNETDKDSAVFGGILPENRSPQIPGDRQSFPVAAFHLSWTTLSSPREPVTIFGKDALNKPFGPEDGAIRKVAHPTP